MKNFKIQKGELFLWGGMQGNWYFVYVGDAASAKIRKEQETLRQKAQGKKPLRGFGAVKVRAKIGKTSWETSIFPTKEGPYILPVKASVRKAEGLFDKDKINVSLEMI